MGLTATIFLLLGMGAAFIVGLVLCERASYRLGLRHGRERAERGMPPQPDEVG